MYNTYASKTLQASESLSLCLAVRSSLESFRQLDLCAITKSTVKRVNPGPGVLKPHTHTHTHAYARAGTELLFEARVSEVSKLCDTLDVDRTTGLIIFKDAMLQAELGVF
jgi:hypothetical protein